MTENKPPLALPLPAEPSQSEQSNWDGYDLDTLRKLRAKALLRREMGRYQMQHSFDNLKTRVDDQGIRGLLFSNKTIGKLRVTDYALLGWRLASSMFKLWYRRKR